MSRSRTNPLRLGMFGAKRRPLRPPPGYDELSDFRLSSSAFLSPPRSPRHAHQNLHLVHSGADEIPLATLFVDDVLIPTCIADFRCDPKPSNRSFSSDAGH